MKTSEMALEAKPVYTKTIKLSLDQKQNFQIKGNHPNSVQ